MNFSEEELNILKALASIECEISKHNLENRGIYFRGVFYRTGNMVCYRLYQEARMKWIGLGLVDKYLKGI